MLSFNILLAFFLSLVSFAGTSNLALPPTAPENTAVEVSEDFPCSWKLDPTYVDSLHTENITQMLGAKRQLFLENRNSDAYKRKKSTRFLPGFLRQTFMPNVSESAMECSADRQCSFLDCEKMADTLTDNEKYLAYKLLGGIEGLMSRLNMVLVASEGARNTINSQLEYLVKTFTWALGQDKFAVEDKVRDKVIAHVQTTIVAVLTPVIAAALPELAPAPGVINGVDSGLTNIVLDLLRYDDKHYQREVQNFGAYFADLAGSFTMDMSRRSNAWAEGFDDDTGNGLEHYVAPFIPESTAVSKPTHSDKIREWMEKMWFSSIINHFWRESFSYIVAVPDTDCGTNDLGAAYLKVCDPERPGWSYDLFTLPPYPQKKSGHDHVMFEDPWVRGPPGFHLLAKGEKYHGINLKAPVVSSVRTWEKFGNSQDLALGAADRVEMLRKATAADIQRGLLPGFWDLPVCLSKSGNFVSSIATSKSRNYPCACGKDFYDKLGVDKDPSLRTSFYMVCKAEDKCKPACKAENICPSGFGQTFKSFWPWVETLVTRPAKALEGCSTCGNQFSDCDNANNHKVVDSKLAHYGETGLRGRQNWSYE